MKTVYVIGPVLGRNRLYREPTLPYLDRIYEYISRRLSQAGFEVVLPEFDSWLEQAPPHAFFRELARRIHSSDLVITIFPELNRSVPVESTMASFLEKEQYIVAANTDQIPKLLRGMPRVARIAKFDDLEQLLTELESRYREPQESPRQPPPSRSA